MKKIVNPEESIWGDLIKRPSAEKEALSELVAKIFLKIKSEGDKAVLQYCKEFDNADVKYLRVNERSITDASSEISSELKSAIQSAKANIEKFHGAQKENIQIIETTPGVFCRRESRAIEKIGIYIPGGSAPLFSTVLMLGIPAILAGCREITLCTPPDKNGEINPAILYTAQLVGIKNIFIAGGIQAIAAMTFGTETIPAVYKIFGPGNQYVTAAKQYAQNFGVAIDMPAGPSEVLIIADKTGIPEFIAADLLSQAEHGEDSQVILLSDDENIIDASLAAVAEQLKELPRNETARKALEKSRAILLRDIDTCIQFSNRYAPEHLIIATENANELTEKITDAGSVFLGNYSCESIGDYASGTNHTLPTNGFARNYSGVSFDSFVKKITFQEVTEDGIKNIGPGVELMAEAEQLAAHKNAVTIRLKSLQNV